MHLSVFVHKQSFSCEPRQSLYSIIVPPCVRYMCGLYIYILCIIYKTMHVSVHAYELSLWRKINDL